jgi:hypothetical protein
VSSPNEPGPPPGPPRTGDGPAGANGSNGAHDKGPAGSGPPSGDVPPWQRGAGRPRQPARAGEGLPPGSQDGPRVGSAAGHSPGTDARLNRFIAGGPAPSAGPPRESAPARDAAPVREPDTAVPAGRSEPSRPDTYASELPDLSAPAPRAPRKQTSERPAAEPSSRSATQATRTQVANRSQGPVRASMQIRRLDPWSVLKVSLVLSVALFFVWMIAVAFLYLVLGGMGVWSKLNSNVGDLLTSASGSGGELVSSGTIFGGAALVGLVNIILLTAMATCGAFIYNLTTDLVGGIEVTLADRD